MSVQDILDSNTVTLESVPVEPNDPMPEAGRKILTHDFLRLRERENNARSTESLMVEDVHQMRVALRRMRSALRLLKVYYKNKAVEPLIDYMKQLATRLGAVRDLDVLMADMNAYAEALSEEDRVLFQTVMHKLEKRRQKAQQKLTTFLNRDAHADFVDAYTEFLITPGKGARSADDETSPHQVRHVLPTLLHEHLGNVRAYDAVVETDADLSPDQLHRLRIEFKRLRYAISNFQQVLGSTAEDFLNDLKAMQDYLGRVNDVTVAQRTLHQIKLDDDQTEVLDRYLAHLQNQQTTLISDFRQEWAKFSKRTVQRKLVNALLTLS
ncbi:MAG: hypothetical protein OHK0046_26670 [Anaerolineae bacterium]